MHNPSNYYSRSEKVKQESPKSFTRRKIYSPSILPIVAPSSTSKLAPQTFSRSLRTNNSLQATKLNSLSIQCRKSVIAKLSPEEIVKNSKFKLKKNEFVLTKSTDNSFSNYFHPKLLVPISTKQLRAYQKEKKLKLAKEYSLSNKRIRGDYLLSYNIKGQV